MKKWNNSLPIYKFIRTTAILMIAIVLASTSFQTKIWAESTKEEEESNTQITYYTIKNGDTLSKIADKYDISISKLKQYNNLKSNLIISGRKLIVAKTEIPYDNSFSTGTSLTKYGKFTITGMAYSEYKETKATKWVEIITEGKPANIDIDLSKVYTYKDMEDIMFNLAKYEGVHLYKIGETYEGRTMYSLSIDFQSDLSLIDGEIAISENGINKDIILSTGQVHAREFAGSIFILKEFNDLIEQAQTDEYVRVLLENVIHVAIPCINPDGREAIVNGGSVEQKTNANGVDLNRNFPSLNAGQLVNSAKLSDEFSIYRGTSFFGGVTLGSEPETKAVMKWLDVFVPIADSLIDYHQQGGGTYSKRDWDTKINQEKYTEFSYAIRKYLNSKVTKNKYESFDEVFEGLDGTGGTVTDYAASVATGSKWSIPYGRLVLSNDKDEDVPLMVFNSLDNAKNSFQLVNSDFVTVTLEICRTRASLGYGSKARKLITEEYDKYNYGEFLIFRSELALGSDKVNEIKN
ncbi:MAG: carboxypeptidase [Clostridiales bacterium]|jgi:LysM repeat protein|nr:carboxypeptidase [Clostridiales bacterium]